MHKKLLVSSVLALTLALAACGQQSGTQPPQTPSDTTSSAPVSGPEIVTVSPYYEFSSQGTLRVISGSQQVEDQTTTDGRLYVQNTQTGETRSLTPTSHFGEAFYAEGGELSPDGKTVYTFIFKDGTWTLQAIDVNSGVTRVLVSKSAQGPFKPEGKTLTVSPNGMRVAFRGYDIVPADGSVRPLHALYNFSTDSISAQSLTLNKTAIESTRLVTPTFDEQGRLGVTELQPFKYVGTELKAQYLGVLGRLPYAGDGILTNTWHGTGTTSGSYGRGLDFVPSTSGAAVRSIAAGTVNYVSFDAGGCGEFVSVDHTTTSYDMFYCHFQRYSTSNYVRAGTALQTGSIMGIFGDTGVVSGPHIHLAVITNNTFGLYGRVAGQIGDCVISESEWVLRRQYGYYGNNAAGSC